MARMTDRKRVKENPSVELVTPYGTKVTVTPSRAKNLLARPGVRLGDGVERTYRSADDAEVEDNPERKSPETPTKAPERK